MAANAGNVDVILDTSGFEVPMCPHGPALLFCKFEAHSESTEGRRFFACSAFRDRKQCPFFQYAGEKVSANKKQARSDENKKQQPPMSHKEYRQRFLQVKKLPQAQRALCESCGLLLYPDEKTMHKEKGHKLKAPITDQMLSRPTEMFSPKDDNKTFAQYLFSQCAVEFVLNSLEGRGVTHVLCIGCPRIHEAIQLKREETSIDSGPNTNSLLLDLDHRYYQMYGPEAFCRYNMFNHFFFDGEDAEKCFKEFIREHDGKRVAMVMDPPFGGMVEALSNTLSKIKAECQCLGSVAVETEVKDVPVLWFFPYFMEKRIVESVQGFSMLDYKVDYDNHMLFTGGKKGRKKGSPVRIFTNLTPKDVLLPATEGYWFCEKCTCYSSAENLHCEKCQSCTTKDGGTYRHCDKCGRCVKPSRVHCDACQTCDLPQHTCGQNLTKGCHICGNMSHKRRDCPQKQKSSKLQADASKRGLKRKQSGKHKGNKRWRNT